MKVNYIKTIITLSDIKNIILIYEMLVVSTRLFLLLVFLNNNLCCNDNNIRNKLKPGS